MFKHWKWILLVIILTGLVFYLTPYNSKLNGKFDPDDFGRYDLLISDTALRKMDSLAKPKHHDFTKSKTWFKAKVILNHDTLKAKIRLKGDKEDHYDTELLSWRLKYKVKGEKQVVSLQHPKTRRYISEWIFHKLLKQEALPYLEYNFVSVYVNNKFKGLYAEEEHFSNYNIEKKWDRVHGPILRYDDEKYWPQGLYKSQAEFGTNSYHEAKINGFNYNKEERNTDMYKRAVGLLREYRDGQLPANQVFDLRLIGKFYALTDLVGGYHSLRWINCRYYYNPKSKIFEPVGFDSDAKRINHLVIHEKNLNQAHHSKIISNPEFLKHYNYFLNKYDKKNFLDDFFEQHEVELNLFLEGFKDQFNVNKSSLKRDLYINQWVIFYNIKKKPLYTGLFVILALILLLKIKYYIKK